MGFKVLLACSQSDLADEFKEEFHQKGFELFLLEEAFLASDDCSVALARLCSEKTPCALVNYVERNPDLRALQVSSLLSEACLSAHIPLIQLSHFDSVDTVQDSESFSEEMLNPNESVMGQIERSASACEKHVILRHSWTIDRVGPSLLASFISPLLENKPLVVSDHNFGNPTYMSYTVTAVVAIVQQILCGAENWGVFHVRSADKCSEAEFCDALVRVLQADFQRSVEMPAVAGVDDDRFFLPGNALLEGDRITRNFGIQSYSWRKGFKAAVQSFLDEYEIKKGASD